MRKQEENPPSAHKVNQKKKKMMYAEFCLRGLEKLPSYILLGKEKTYLQHVFEQILFSSCAHFSLT